MEIGLLLGADLHRGGAASVAAWARLCRHPVVELPNIQQLSDRAKPPQVQVVIASDAVVSFADVRQWRTHAPEIEWILLTDTPSFGWAEEAILSGVIGFASIPVSGERLDALIGLASARRQHQVHALLGVDPSVVAIDFSQPIESALEYIAEHLAERLTLRDVSREVYLSPSHFSRLFVQRVGMHFNDYVLEQRISAAKTLLTETRVPIELIAAKVGFCSASYFSQTFRRWVATTPREYRQSAMPGAGYLAPGSMVAGPRHRPAR